MKKQTKLRWQTIVHTTIATIVFVFAANSLALAQTVYKVGDRVEVKSSGEWVKAEVRKVENNGFVYVRFDGSASDVMTLLDYVRPAGTTAPANDRKNSGGENPIPTNRNERTDNPATDEPNKTTKGNKYGTRDPRTCTDMKAPAKGAPTAALAQKYVICEIEKVSGPYLYLVENVKVEVGGGRPYNRNSDINVPEINARLPIYSIRGSLTKYQCYEVNPSFTVSAPDKNCTRYEEPKAKGDCYKTTFGDWRCFMTDLSNKNENWFTGVAPPKP